MKNGKNGNDYMKKQPLHEIQRKQFEIANDKPFTVRLGKKTYRCKYLKGKSQDLISYLHLSQKVIDSDDPKEILAAMNHNNRIHAKVVAVMILNSFWRLKLYPIFWRWIYHTYSSAELAEAMQIVAEANGTQFFFQNTIYLTATNTLKMKLTKKEAEQLLAEQESEKKPPSVKSSV